MRHLGLRRSPSSSLPTRQPERGYTLAELLVGLTLGVIFLGATAGIVVRTMTADRRESARTETQADMQRAMRFIADDIKNAAYIYNDEFTSTTLDVSSPDGIPDLNQILDPTGTANDLIPTSNPTAQGTFTPVLAFWKLTVIPNDCKTSLGTGPTPIPTTPPSYNQEATEADFKLRGVVYELVVYYRTTNAGTNNWSGQGPNRITRAVYSPFTGINSTCVLVPTYVPPNPPFFSRWPRDESGALIALNGSTVTAGTIQGNFGNRDTLVGFLDNSTDNFTSILTCAGDYIPGADNSQIPFYACVRRKDTSGNPSLAQDAIIGVLGNAFRRAGLSSSFPPVDPPCGLTGDPTYCLTLQTQVFARTYFDRNPR